MSHSKILIYARNETPLLSKTKLVLRADGFDIPERQPYILIYGDIFDNFCPTYNLIGSKGFHRLRLVIQPCKASPHKRAKEGFDKSLKAPDAESKKDFGALPNFK